VLGWLRSEVRKLYYDLLIGRLGYSRPVPAGTWDEEYARGDWALLDAVEEMPHHMLVVGYAHALRPPAESLPAILDVGCGHGRLLQLLAPYGLSSYLGIDVSTEAVRLARSLGVANASFEVADFEEWKASTKFGAIVFSESLFYAARPLAVLTRYAGWLEKGGVFIVSQWRHGNHGIIWSHVQTRFHVLHAAKVENTKGQIWDVRVLRPKGGHDDGDSHP
jgi:SAM-dependent methyltransferase